MLSSPLPLVTDHPVDFDNLVDLFYATLLDLLNKHEQEGEKVVPDRTNSAWIEEAVIRMMQARRSAERKKRRTGLVVVCVNRSEVNL